ncbi:inter-alpha-trypsin inhibitor heavy chain H4-like [Schistocerca americana]|uniref:inter-alpha-trypsin inhibitor heavy chain H4-like n=1 Tax=Schistocerca americana TaxID=7009 RepID=UPI001F4F7F0C|nr:inter-alpha-trypsin inhibitor heavy chain H4-like [Schistocerca americana]
MKGCQRAPPRPGRAVKRPPRRGLALCALPAAPGHCAGGIRVVTRPPLPGHARDSNVVRVSVNVEAQKKVTFNMTYDELLQREPVDDLAVEVRMQEQAPLLLVEVPTLQESNEVLDWPGNVTDPLARIESPTSSSAIVRWAPTREEQQQRGNRGVSGQLVVRYDVDRDASPSQVLVSNDGYFVHFYAPAGLPPLPKHDVFVLDVSGSMRGRKIEQLKTAMSTILDQLNAGDLFSLIPFSSAVQVWHPDVPLRFHSTWEENLNSEFNSSAIVEATSEIIAKAKRSFNSFAANGGTYMFSALKTALRVSKKRVASGGGSLGMGRRRHAPMVVLLTDGEANGSYLRRLALRNSGISRRTYEAAGAHQQLRNFYRQIASPLLTDVKFNYDGQQVDEDTLTRARFPTLFSGAELVVAGRRFPGVRRLFCRVTSRAGRARDAVPQPAVANVTSAEWLWAYLSGRQMLEQDAPNDTVRARAKDIALRTDGTFQNCTTPTGTTGVCRHIAACLLRDFQEKLDVFLSGYLCIIKGG